MAEEAPKISTTQQAAVHVEEVVVTDVNALADKTANTTVPDVEKDPEPEEPVTEKKKPVEEAVTTVDTTDTDASKTSGDHNNDKIPESGSFKEESTRVSDLPEIEKKALQGLKQLIQEALNKHEFSAPLNAPSPPKEDEEGKPGTETLAADNKEEAKEKEMEKEKPVEEEQVSEPVADVATPEPAEPDDKPTKTEEGEGEKKEEDQPTKADEEGKKKEEEAGPEVKETTEPEQPTKEEGEKKEEEEAAAAPPPPEVKETKVVAPSIDEDGAKTVEAIEETVVAVSSTVPEASAKEEEAAVAPAEEAKETNKDEAASLPPEEVSIWGVPLLADERSDVILLKFLRARDFKVKDAFTMIKNTIRWRKEFGIDRLIEQEDLGDDLEKVVYMHGFDKEGHPVCYNIYGEFQNKEMYKKTFSDEEKRQKFLRWRIQFLERSIRKLDFTPGGISTIVQVNDLKNSPGPGKWELRQATKQALQLLQDNYPEFVAKQVFVNVPWWYLAVNRMISPFLTQRTKSKFVFAGPSKSAETLLRYIAPEQLPVKYGGLSKDGEFGNTDAVTEITVKPAAKHTVEFPVTENCLLSWELRVIGWDVSYGAEFVPSAEGSYTVIIQKARKVASSEEPVVCNSYKIGEPGKVVLTIDNPSSKKKKLLYRLKTKPSSSD